MQYILTAEEFQQLTSVGDRAKAELKETLQRLCTDVANHKPILYWNNKEPRVWGCILIKASYCDCCPVRGICPYENKQFSK